MLEHITSLPPFNKAAPSELRRLLSHFHQEQFRHNKALYYQEDWAERAFFIISGNVILRKWRSDQSSFICMEKTTGTWIGVGETHAGGAYLCDAESVSETKFLSTSAKGLKDLLEYPLMRTSILDSLTRDLYIIHGKLGAPGSIELISTYLSDLCTKETKNEKTEILLKITQEKLAAAVGLTRETVSKHLRQLQKDGIILLGRGTVLILRKEMLER